MGEHKDRKNNNKNLWLFIVNIQHVRSLNGITNDRVNNNNYPLKKNQKKRKSHHSSCFLFIGDFPQFNAQQQEVKKQNK